MEDACAIRAARWFVGWLRRDGWLGAVTLELSLAVLVVLLGFRDLPMVDLPQHAAQIATWERWDAGVPAVVSRFELNFRTPYLLAYPLARVLAPAVGAVVALKLVVWLSVVLNLSAVTALARRLGHDPWLGLFGMVTALGLCFYFGFVSFMLAIPLAVGSVLLALGQRERPSGRDGALLALLLCLLLTAHGVAFVMGFGTVGLLLLRGRGSWLGRLAPLAPPVLVAVFWIAPGPVSERIGADVWDPALARWRELPAALVGMSSSDHASFVLGSALMLVAALALGGRPARTRVRALPLALLLAAYGLFPSMFRGVVLLHTRLPCFLLPVALLAFEPRALTDTARRRLRGGIVAVTLAWLGLFSVRLVAFQREAAGFHALEAGLPTGLAMRPLVFDRDSRVFPGVPAFLHYSAYYYVDKGGSQGYSFAMYPLSVVRFRPGVAATMRGGAEWRPDLFQRREIARYDYFLVRSADDVGPVLFSGAPVTLVAHDGEWWGYARERSALALGAATRAPRAASPGGS